MAKLLIKLLLPLVLISDFVHAQSISLSNTVQQVYIAYYGRPGDPAGISYWVSRLEAAGGNLSAIINDFGNSEEFAERYGSLSNSELLDTIYQQMFGRLPDAAGKVFFLEQLELGEMSLQTITLDILNGSTGNDATIIQNKTEAASYFTERVNTAGFDYGKDSIDGVITIFNGIGSADTSFEQAVMSIETLVEEDSNTPQIPASLCQSGQLKWQGLLQYAFSGDLNDNSGGCATATGSGISVTFKEENNRHFLSLGDDALVTFPTSLNSEIYSNDTFEFSFHFYVPVDIELPRRVILLASKTGRSSEHPGFALIIHGESWGTQFILTYFDKSGVGQWHEMYDVITPGQWHEVSVTFDMNLGKWRVVFDNKVESESFPEGFNRTEFIQQLQSQTMVFGATGTSKDSTYNDSVWVDTLSFYAPARYQSDSDNDGISDDLDALPYNALESKDTDNDGIGDNTDRDDDGDGIADIDDRFPRTPYQSIDSIRSSRPTLPASSDTTFNVTWTPSKSDNCDPLANISPSIPVASKRLAELDDGRIVYEPAILFSDDAFTMMIKKNSQGGNLSLASIIGQVFTVLGQNSEVYLYDDGTHGDHAANDGVYTRACLSLAQPFPATDNFQQIREAFFVNPNLRGSETLTTIAEGVRMNDIGLFFSLGDTYRNNLQQHWYLFNVPYCYACQYAWHLFGSVFDFFVMHPRESWGGGGYTRVHDFIEGTGHNPPYANYSHSNTPMLDGKEHLEYMGMLWLGWPPLSGLSHELGHGLLGINTEDFPGTGEQQWNEGDGAHIDSLNTTTGPLQGHIWDPIRGWPYDLKLNDGSPFIWDYPNVSVARDNNGKFYLKPMDQDRYIWSDIFLYMMGLISADDSNEVYYKLINPTYGDCDTIGNYYVCNDTTINANQSARFEIADMVERYGPWQSNVSSYDPTLLNVGNLYVSDRLHTEAEITMLSIQMRQFIQPGKIQLEGSDEYSWWWTTRGLSNIKVDFRDGLLP